MQTRTRREYTTVSLIVNCNVSVPQLKPWGSPNITSEGSVCNCFPPPVIHSHISAVLHITLADALWLQELVFPMPLQPWSSSKAIGTNTKVQSQCSLLPGTAWKSSLCLPESFCWSKECVNFPHLVWAQKEKRVLNRGLVITVWFINMQIWRVGFWSWRC